MHAVIHAADVQDRDGGVLVMASLFGLYPFLLKLYAEGYQGAQFKAALERVMRQVNLEIVRSPRRPSSFCLSVGSSKKLSASSIAAEDWPRIGNV